MMSLANELSQALHLAVRDSQLMLCLFMVNLEAC
jgi:hypothetical protein